MSTINETEDVCAVCGANSTGYHYGCYACEGCKSFFKRTVQKNLTDKYKCQADGDCEITQESRAKCQACRLKKCLSVGMVFGGVRGDRQRGGRSFYPLKTADDVSDNQDCPQSSTTDSGKDSPSPTTSEASNSPQPKTILQQLLEASPAIIPPGEYLLRPPLQDLESNINIPLTRLSNGISLELKLIVDWAKEVPGFSSLLKEDKIMLLSSSALELMVFRVLYRSMPYEDSLHMNQPTVLKREQCYIFLSEELVDGMLEIVQRLRQLTIDENEFACLNAILLFNCDSEGLVDRETVEKQRQNVMETLKEYTEQKQPGRFAKILLRLPVLRQVCNKGYHYFVRVQSKLEGEVTMSTLLTQMFEKTRI